MEIILGLLSEQVPNGVMAFTPKGQNVVRFTDIDWFLSTTIRKNVFTVNFSNDLRLKSVNP